MKPKSVFPLVILSAAILAASIRQSPAPVVGYVNDTLSSGWNLIANPFIPDTNNNANVALSISNPTAADGSLLYRFNPATQSYYDASTYFTGVGWYPLSGDTNDPVLSLPLGEGFFIWTPQSWIATFAGYIPQGSLTNPLPANFSLKASMAPMRGPLETSLLFPPYPGDEVWRCVSSDFVAYTYDDTNFWQPSEPSIEVSEGFFLHRSPDQATTNHWWIRNFQVNIAQRLESASQTTPGRGGDSPSATLSGLSLQNGYVVLRIDNPSGTPYDIQCSPDGLSWSTVASGQTATRWKEPLRQQLQGYYQVVNP